MNVQPRYSHHRHTGRLRPHRETSYALLGFVLLCSMVAMTVVSARVDAAGSAGAWTAEKPAEKAVITSVSDGQTLQANPVSVSGTCADKTLVKVFKNGAIAGSAVCDGERRFSLKMDLLVGSNTLTARSYNAKHEAGPDGSPIRVTLAADPGGPGFSTELVLQSTAYVVSGKTGDELVWPLEIVGGVAPYAVSVDWGDKQSDVAARVAAGPFTQKHTYAKAGGYLSGLPVVVQATDSVGHKSYLQLVSIVQEPIKKSGMFAWFNIVMIWPILGLLVLMVVSFWLGERREKSVLNKRLVLLENG